MVLPPGVLIAPKPTEEIDAEAHVGNDRLFHVEKGKDEAWIDGKRSKIKRDEVLIRPITDFTALRPDDFWRVLDARWWRHPYVAAGRRRAFSEIPAEIDDLRDDPFRSLASALRWAGGFAKKSTPFSAFAWADFLRPRIASDAVARDFEWAIGRALILAGIPAARGLPGWMAEPQWKLDARASLASPNVAR